MLSSVNFQGILAYNKSMSHIFPHDYCSSKRIGIHAFTLFVMLCVLHFLQSSIFLYNKIKKLLLNQIRHKKFIISKIKEWINKVSKIEIELINNLNLCGKYLCGHKIWVHLHKKNISFNYLKNKSLSICIFSFYKLWTTKRTKMLIHSNGD